MLSISGMAAGQANYYAELAREDYYVEGGEPRGAWIGKGAAALGLSGKVSKAALRNLFDGISPDGSERLVQAQRCGSARERRAGFDLTFSAPKSVSTLWAISSSQTRAVIQEAHFDAVAAAVGYLEHTEAFTRRGGRGERLKRAELTVAVFEHGTSRAQDPQLHSHALLLNVGRATDGSFGALRHPDLFRHKMAAGAVYRAELVCQLRAGLGLTFSPLRNWFEVDGVPKELSATFSTRRHEIEAALAEQGLRGAKASELAALTTRSRKGHVSRAELFEAWQEVGEAHSFSRLSAEALIRRGSTLSPRSAQRALEQATSKAIEEITASDAFFQEKDVVLTVE